MRNTSTGTPAGRSRGIALPTALLVLVVLSLLGTAAVFMASTEADIAGNGRQDLRTLSMAEAGVHEALARLNMKAGAAPTRIIPQEAAGVPVAAWSRTIVNKSTLASSELQTVTGAFGAATALPVQTTVQYKKESATETPFHCNGATTAACNDEVVLFHTTFQYTGTTVPTGSQLGVPVLQIASTYSDPIGNRKTVTVDAVRTITSIGTPGTVRACGRISCSGSPNAVNGTQHPDGGAVISGVPGGTGCNDSRVEPDPSADPDAVRTESCPTPATDLFKQTFGVTTDQMRQMADLVTAAPYNPPSMNGKIVYVTGSAQSTWQGNKLFGASSQSSGGSPVTCDREPVIFVVEGDLRMQGTIDFCGIIYVMGSITLGSGNFKLRGAIIAQGDADMALTGNSNFTYDPTVIDNLKDLSPFTLIMWDVNR